MPAILWAIVLILILFWIFGLAVNLGTFVWLALVVALGIALYNLLTGRAAY